MDKFMDQSPQTGTNQMPKYGQKNLLMLET